MQIKHLTKNTALKYADNLEKLMKQVYFINLPDQNYDKNFFLNKVNEMISFAIKKKALVYICEDKGLKGFIWFFKYSFVNETRVHINEIVIDQSQRGVGYGSKLLEKAVQYAKKEKITKIDLNVSSNNTGGVEFYKLKGFNIERYQMTLETKMEVER